MPLKNKDIQFIYAFPFFFDLLCTCNHEYIFGDLIRSLAIEQP